MIKVFADRKIKNITNFWNNLHFHPTDAIEDEWGQRILDKVSEDGVARMVRMYTMFEDIVTKDENGRLCYDYTLNDIRLDYMVKKGFDLLICYNFVPFCVAENPSLVKANAKNKTRYKGKMICTAPPKDDGVWEEICYEYTKHIVERYGFDVVSKWRFHCLNESDISNFFMSDLPNCEEAGAVRYERYIKLYKEFQRGIERVDKRLCFGGPSAAILYDRGSFVQKFSKAIADGEIRADFISIHTYGTNPGALNSGSKLFDAENTMELHKKYVEEIKKNLPNGIDIIVDEWGAATAGYLNIDECPALMFREKSDYAAYFGKMITSYIKQNLPVSKMLICLSGQHEMTTDFSGFRNFFTLNFIKKPIYNAFVLGTKLGCEMVEASGECENMTSLATKDEDGRLAVMLAYAPKNFNETLEDKDVALNFEGVKGKRAVRVWIIDEKHTNPYALSLREGIGNEPSDEQIEQMREEGILKPVSELENDFDVNSKIKISLTNNALAVVEVL